MPSSPSLPSAGASSRGIAPASNQSPTYGSTRSATNARTVSRMSRSSSDSSASSARKSCGRIGAGGAAADVKRAPWFLEILMSTQSGLVGVQAVLRAEPVRHAVALGLERLPGVDLHAAHRIGRTAARGEQEEREEDRAGDHVERQLVVH